MQINLYNGGAVDIVDTGHGVRIGLIQPWLDEDEQQISWLTMTSDEVRTLARHLVLEY